MNMLDVFYWVWFALDVLFTGIESTLLSLFPAIPESAISLVVSIVFYSIIAVFDLLVSNADKATKRIVFKVLLYFSIILAILIVIWRFGVINMVSTVSVGATFSALVISIVYVGVFVGIILAFFVINSDIVKNLILLITWALLIIITIFIAPATNELQLSANTVPQLVFLSIIFAVPRAFKQYQKSINEGE